MMPVAATDFVRNFPHYRDAARRAPVAVAAHDRVVAYLISPDDFAAWQNAVPRPIIDPKTRLGIETYLDRIAADYQIERAILFGSRARGDHHDESDADLAVVLGGPRGPRAKIAIDMAGPSFDVLMETDVLVQAWPFWQEDFESPSSSSNPALIEAIERDGIEI